MSSIGEFVKTKIKIAPIGLDCRQRNIKNNIIFRFRVDFISLMVKVQKIGVNEYVN